MKLVKSEIMFKPKIGEQERLKREAERRAKFNQQRLARMKDSKNWNRGFSVDDIETQKQEKLNRIQAVKNEETEYSKHILSLTEESLVQEKERNMARRKRLHEASQALLAVDKKQTDTFDLNNPHIVREDRPPRVDDGLVPVSGLQKFDGEDLGFLDRQRKQQSEMKARLESQMGEHEARKAVEKQSDREYAAFIIKQTEHLEQMEELKKQRNHKSTIDVAFENSRILKEKEEKLNLFKTEQVLIVERDIETTKESSLLAERMEDTLRVGNSGRYVPYGFKGFGMDKTMEFFNQRKEQAEEHENSKMKMKQEELDWAAQQNAQRREMLKIEMERRRGKLSQREQYAKDLQEQAKAHKKILLKTKQEFTNEVTEDFFSQFGTSHR